ncbi:MAG: hypothetical protein EXR39_09890 [Betaproteobacteria bacterium]|nr:hypothetical protein [Betaproteobacteria bacterium]
MGAWGNGIGQDLVNVGILFVALLMLAWHCIWISTHGHGIAREARKFGAAVRVGDRAPFALMIAVALAVLREGAETVMFVAGSATGAGTSAQALSLGVVLGLAAGSLLGTLIYVGLARIRPERLFAVTNMLIMLLAASIASQLAWLLLQAGLVDLWSESVWDSSGLLTNDSPIGAVLHAVMGYDAPPRACRSPFTLPL